MARFTSRRSLPALALGVLVLAAIVVAIVSAARSRGGTRTPVRVQPVGYSSDVGQRARNLSAWLREHAR